MSNLITHGLCIFNPFLEDYAGKYTASSISKKTKIPQQTVSRQLDYFVKKNQISYERKGKNKLFYFDFENYESLIILNLAELNKALNFMNKNKNIALLIEKILKIAESIIIFGSYASENFTKESDIDLVIINAKNKKEIKQFKKQELIEINEHYISYEEFKKKLSQKNPLILEIKRNHLLFGNVSKIVKIFAYE